MSQESVEVVIRGYRAFLAGDLEAIVDMLDPEIEWHAIDQGPWDSAHLDDVLEVIGARLGDGFRVELERCIGLGERVVVSFRAAREQRDPNDDRPLQTRRMFTIGRYSAVVTIRDGRVVHVQDYPHLTAALESVGIDGEVQ